jgi:hypothetical protein
MTTTTTLNAASIKAELDSGKPAYYLNDVLFLAKKCGLYSINAANFEIFSDPDFDPVFCRAFQLYSKKPL